MDAEEIEQYLATLGQPKFRSRQLYRWIYNRRATDFDQMTDLSKQLRTQLKDLSPILPLKVSELSEGFDSSSKLLFELSDGDFVEGVLIPEEERLTACLSSQVGCALGCKFCATGYLGFLRNLTAGEIVGQLILLEKTAGRLVTNVVMMGMGEPLLNSRSLFKAVKLMTDPNGLSMARRRLTISTVGWIPGIEAMITANLRVKLAISLNGTTEQQRERLMPMASRYPIDKILVAGGKYANHAGIRVQIGYLLLAGFNDSLADARRLVTLVKGIDCKINIMQYNSITLSDDSINVPFKRTSEDQRERFVEILRSANLVVTQRTSRGKDINGACGQLAGKHRLI